MHLTKLERSLQQLRLQGTGITEAGTVYLSRLSSLSELYLDRTTITDLSASHLISLRALTVLSLSQTQITDATLQCFHEQAARFRSGLRELNLSKTAITDKGTIFLQRWFSFISAID